MIDASVAIKWLIPESPEEQDVPQALALLNALKDERIALYQPAHWEAEIAGVLTRLSPATAVAKIVAIRSLIFTRVNETTVYATACDLAIRLNHHLFDTLYHAVALHTPESILVTADSRYFEKACALGQISLLSSLNLSR
ncbi:MAG TPA: type II toxin-antitoxin system VapC family toxin [Candidatus Competibacter sp.]|nr:type II toxin-antitoxin system VapC family toxin [Candidatus Competibacter sp.]HUM94109.1 type II toxin-antitoxin system VapC family toxin [Candidatus Competibacter sp.]